MDDKKEENRRDKVKKSASEKSWTEIDMMLKNKQ